MFTFVRAQTSGLWPTVDIYDRAGHKAGEKRLIRALEQSRWCINNRPVEVVPGLCVTCIEENDAAWFLSQERPVLDGDGRPMFDALGRPVVRRMAQMVEVEPEAVVMFESEDDAMFFVRSGLGEKMSEREVQQMIEAIQAKQQEMIDAQAEDGEQGDQGGPAQEADRAPRKRGRSRKAA